MNSQSAGNSLGTNHAADAGKRKDDEASTVASMRDTASKFAENARSSVSEYAASGAQAIKGAAEEGSSQIASAVRGAADRVESISNSVRDTSMSDLMASVGEFAGKKPMAFFGCGVLVGVVLSRLLSNSDR